MPSETSLSDMSLMSAFEREDGDGEPFALGREEHCRELEAEALARRRLRSQHDIVTFEYSVYRFALERTKRVELERAFEALADFVVGRRAGVVVVEAGD